MMSVDDEIVFVADKGFQRYLIRWRGRLEFDWSLLITELERLVPDMLLEYHHNNSSSDKSSNQRRIDEYQIKD